MIYIKKKYTLVIIPLLLICCVLVYSTGQKEITSDTVIGITLDVDGKWGHTTEDKDVELYSFDFLYQGSYLYRKSDKGSVHYYTPEDKIYRITENLNFTDITVKRMPEPVIKITKNVKEKYNSERGNVKDALPVINDIPVLEYEFYIKTLIQDDIKNGFRIVFTTRSMPVISDNLDTVYYKINDKITITEITYILKNESDSEAREIGGNLLQTCNGFIFSIPQKNETKENTYRIELTFMTNTGSSAHYTIRYTLASLHTLKSISAECKRVSGITASQKEFYRFFLYLNMELKFQALKFLKKKGYLYKDFDF